MVEKEPEVETFFNVLELTIKNAMKDVYPHHKRLWITLTLPMIVYMMHQK